ncbi:hypothetical protein HMPREF9700_01924 [Bergeyella zoohelcum CCUG 30536]|uniref:type VI secretion system Vgr family protein n=1 Tax=Bergeyella zoohelcum TaxID=1015 RepID=UPI000280CC26|nr:phage baseplate assembly protein V [Bergeyella zoohelcum]EKB58472.1 hypothetical protein HMPREF9700_01924 [Bergeyella zoohelcum CCUG 30536]
MLQHKPNGNKKIAQPTSKIYNAASIALHRLQGMNRVVEVKIVIEGTFIKVFNHFSLWQSASKHHRFELKLPFDALDDDENHELNAAQQFIGKRLTAMFSYKDIEDSPERAFVGVIMEVGYEQQESSLGSIVITGYSPTILLDLAPHTQSFGGQQSISLDSIAEQVIKEGINKDKYQVRVDCAYTKNLLYAAQYNETHYNYLARMAEAYGEQFFYDGEVLHFGQLPVPEKPLELIYGSNLSDVKVKMQARHVNPTFYGYSSSRDQKLTSVEAQVNHVSDIAKRAYQISKSKITTPSLRVAPIRASTDKDIEASQNGAAGSNASEVFVTTGSTSIPFLYPGCTADLRMRKRDTHETGYFTKIMITEVYHQVDGRGHYTGRFEAIASDSGHLPRPDFELPLAEAQVAKVISNADPENQGRVQVRFDWQLHDTTDWIRVMTPDAGSSSKVSKNRGFMAIPEVGDQVMIGFQHNHPDRPFVMGGMFHGKVGAGGGVDNRVKSLQTRSGHRLIFTEDESIILTDKSGNEIKLDTEGGNINITAPETMTFKAKNMNIEVGENLRTNVGMNSTESVGMNKTTNIGLKHLLSIGADFATHVIGKLTYFIKGDMETHGEKDQKMVSLQEMQISSLGELQHHSEKQVQNNSAERSKSF